MLRHAIALACLLPSLASAEDIAIELNSLAPKDAACRLIFTAKSDAGVEGLVLETALFDARGAVMMLTLFDFLDLPAGSLRVRQFDLAGQSCDGIGRILFNGIDSCNGAGCADALSFTSRIENLEVLG